MARNWHRGDPGNGRSRGNGRRSYLEAVAAVGLAGITGVAGCLSQNQNPEPPPPSVDGTTADGQCSKPLSSPPDPDESSSEGGSVAWEQTSPTSPVNVFPLDESHVLVETRDGMLAALARDTGDVSWETDVADSIGYQVLVEGDTILASGVDEATDGLTETLYALDAESGEERWTALTRDLIPGGFAPQGGFDLIDATRRVVFVRDYRAEPSDTLPVHSVSLTDGSTRWSTEVRHFDRRALTHMRGETIYYGTREGVIAFEPDGSRRWEWSPDTPGTDSPRTDTRVEGVALVCDHVAVLTVTEPELGYGKERTIHGIDIETGESQWTADAWSGAGLNSHRGRLVVGGDTHARLDLASGDVVWTRENLTLGFTPTGDLTLGYGLVFGYTETADRKVITASTIPDGTIEWEHVVDTVAAPVGAANGRLIISMETDESSRLAGIDAATGDRNWELESEFHGPVVGPERMYVIHVPDQDDAQATVRAVTI